MSFKVIDVGTTGKLVSSAYYDKQQVCVSLHPFCSHARRANNGKITISWGGVPIFGALVRGESRHLAAPNYLIIN